MDLIEYAIYSYYNRFNDDFVAIEEYDKILLDIASRVNYDEYIKEIEKYEI